jgi:hypothetical protein
MASRIIGQQSRFGRAPPSALSRTAVLFACLFVIGNARPNPAAAQEPVQMAQGPGEVLDMAKSALGLGEKTQEGEASTGIPFAVPFLVRFQDTVGDLEAGAQVLLKDLRRTSAKRSERWCAGACGPNSPRPTCSRVISR